MVGCFAQLLDKMDRIGAGIKNLFHSDCEFTGCFIQSLVVIMMTVPLNLVDHFIFFLCDHHPRRNSSS